MKTVDWDFKSIDVDCDNPDGCKTNTFNFSFDEYPDFQECQKEIEDYGWESHKIDGEWYDFCCHDCYIKFLQDSIRKDQWF